MRKSAISFSLSFFRKFLESVEVSSNPSLSYHYKCPCTAEREPTEMVSPAPDSRKWPNPALYKIVDAKRWLARLTANFGTAKLFHSAALKRVETRPSTLVRTQSGKIIDTAWLGAVSRPMLKQRAREETKNMSANFGKHREWPEFHLKGAKERFIREAAGKK
ncbi:hypothetical protein [Nevskia soli]|uniref:hypothetical protein n=1 Tax=Nevskia soli TaxID=418856 RepID=UPI0015D79DF6|nr:hypothetical protein [Nevskia soli]